MIAQAESGGLSSLGLNWQAFLFQLVAFVIMLVILSKFVFPKIVRILEERRQALEGSLTQARQTEETLRDAETKAARLVTDARARADQTLADSRVQAKELVAAAESAAALAAQRLVSDTQTKLTREREQLRDDLKGELAGLVAEATEKVTAQKLKGQKDSKLIEEALRGVSR